MMQMSSRSTKPTRRMIEKLRRDSTIQTCGRERERERCGKMDTTRNVR
jgi:hypothetical protein